MSENKGFSSWLAPLFERFVALKRAGGACYVTQERILRAFDRYLGAKTPRGGLTRDAVLDYLASLTCSPRAKDNVVSVVWQALGYAIRHGACVEALGERPPKPPSYWREREPRLVSESEVQALITAARELPPLNILRPATMATLIGLLFTTGLRIGEALALDVGHLDCRDGILTVVRGKFGKTRALPLRESTIDALVRYLEDRRRHVATYPSAPLFVSARRRRLTQPTVFSNLLAVCDRAGISKPWPRPHDFRHNFAVNRVLAWYTQGRNVQSLLAVLSTYLGHNSIENTRVYLRRNGALLEQAAARFAEHTTMLDEVLT